MPHHLRHECLHDNDTNMSDGVTTALGLPYDEKIVMNHRSTTVVLNMTKTVVDLRDLSQPTKKAIAVLCCLKSFTSYDILLGYVVLILPNVVWI